MRATIAEAAEKAGRDPKDVAITSLLPTSVAETREEAFDAMRPGLAFYCGFFPRYNRLVAEYGFADEAAAIAEAFACDGLDAAIGLVTDAMVDATGVAGTPEECRDKIEAYRASGIDLPIISPFARGPGSKARITPGSGSNQGIAQGWHEATWSSGIWSPWGDQVRPPSWERYRLTFRGGSLGRAAGYAV